MNRKFSVLVGFSGRVCLFKLTMIVLRQGYKDFDSSLDNFGALLNLLEDEDEVGRVSVLSNSKG